MGKRAVGPERIDRCVRIEPSRSNCNLVSSEGIAYRPRQLASRLLTELRPLVLFFRRALLDNDLDALVVGDSVERMREFQHALVREVFGFDVLAHCSCL